MAPLLEDDANCPPSRFLLGTWGSHVNVLFECCYVNSRSKVNVCLLNFDGSWCNLASIQNTARHTGWPWGHNYILSVHRQGQGTVQQVGMFVVGREIICGYRNPVGPRSLWLSTVNESIESTLRTLLIKEVYRYHLVELVWSKYAIISAVPWGTRSKPSWRIS